MAPVCREMLKSGAFTDSCSEPHFLCYAAQVYNPSTNTWSRTTGQCYTGISAGPLALLATGKVLLAGGSIIYSGKASPVAHTNLYDTSTNAWVGTGLLNQARSGHTLTRLVNGQALAAGGFSESATGTTTFLSSSELYTCLLYTSPSPRD